MYMHSAPIFNVDDVNLMIRLTKFGNFGELVWKPYASSTQSNPIIVGINSGIDTAWEQLLARITPHCKFAQKKQNLTKMLDAPAKFEVIN
jgi:hypothetical protein